MSLLRAARIGRDVERQRVLRIVELFTYAASISPNGAVAEGVLVDLTAAIAAHPASASPDQTAPGWDVPAMRGTGDAPAASGG